MCCPGGAACKRMLQICRVANQRCCKCFALCYLLVLVLVLPVYVTESLALRARPAFSEATALCNL